MDEQSALKTENLALKRENARLHKVIDILTKVYIESIHEQSSLAVDRITYYDKGNSTKNNRQNEIQ
ncbi:hypothetical protein ACVRY7_10645 [Streptococcus ictaluri]|uniref:Uncharacterized protein n=1 Tax=Streptococcus ictaluri 707-05 TaxID=764299 RepID=G5K3S8_9STRE|nr:hypothetical protein [Streptococcus ictaluri]EHI69840.1 hypothetical protein STRIC_1449 [Streptococcus ictaluri 707-05]